MNDPELLALAKAYKDSHDACEAAYANLGNDNTTHEYVDNLEAAEALHKDSFKAAQRLLKFIQAG